MVGRLVTGLLMLVAAALTFVLDSARQAFDLMLSIGAGTGLIYLLRWFWWRINAWSEIAAMVSSFLVSTAFFVAARLGHGIDSSAALVITILVTSIVWLSVTYLTRPTDDATLEGFYRRIRPAGPGWTRIRQRTGLGPSPDSLPQQFLGWMLGCLFVYSALFGSGSMLYGKWPQATVWSCCFVISGVWLVRLLRRMWAAPPGGQAD